MSGLRVADTPPPIAGLPGFQAFPDNSRLNFDQRKETKELLQALEHTLEALSMILILHTLLPPALGTRPSRYGDLLGPGILSSRAMEVCIGDKITPCKKEMSKNP